MLRREEEGEPDARILRPDKFLYRKKKDLDDRIKKEMVPELILEYNLSNDGEEVSQTKLFKGKYNWLLKRVRGNAGLIAAYIEKRVNDLVGNHDRSTWRPEEYESAKKHAEDIYVLIKKMLDSEM